MSTDTLSEPKYIYRVTQFRALTNGNALAKGRASGTLLRTPKEQKVARYLHRARRPDYPVWGASNPGDRRPYETTALGT